MKRYFWGLIILLVLSNSLYAQNRRKFQADYDVKNIRFGYLIGLFGSNFHIVENRAFIQSTDTVMSLTSKPNYGFKLGGLVNFSLNDYWDFRILPTVSLPTRNLELIGTNGTSKFSQKDKAWFEIPVMIKYKSERRGNERMYIFGGFRYGIETNASLRVGGKSRNTKNDIPIKGSDFSIEYGVGLELFREYFKFAPELHFSHGMTNLIDPVRNSTTYLKGVERMSTHSVTLYFIFE